MATDLEQNPCEQHILKSAVTRERITSATSEVNVMLACDDVRGKRALLFKQ